MVLVARARLAAGLSAAAALGLVLAAGCNKQNNSTGSGMPTGGPSSGMMQGRGMGGPGGPGGPGGMMGGPGMMGRGPGGMMGGAPVAENASGAEIYQAKCQGCHGANGQGGRGGPSLAKAAGKSDADLIKIVHDGKERMPAFGTQLKDDQIKKVVAEAKKRASSK